MIKKLLGVNIDHIATLRNARDDGGISLLKAAEICKQAGAHGITIHLREDRRHIRDADVADLASANILPINFECAATDEMVKIAIQNKVDAVCFVPEKREERTTESGLDVAFHLHKISNYTRMLNENGIAVSLFVDANKQQIEYSKAANVQKIEIHTGAYANGLESIEQIVRAAKLASSLGLDVHAGHGLDIKNIINLVQIPEISMFNIGYSIVCNSIFLGLDEAVKTILLQLNVDFS